MIGEMKESEIIFFIIPSTFNVFVHLLNNHDQCLNAAVLGVTHSLNDPQK